MAAPGAGRLRRAASALLLQSPRLPARELSAPARLYHKKVSEICEVVVEETRKELGSQMVLIDMSVELSTQVVDHYENPRNVGSLDKTSKNVGTGLVGAPACGDVMKLQIQVDEKGKIVDARFKTFGCGSAIASSSLATEWVKGKTVEEALTIKNTDIAKELCLPPVKLHCSKSAVSSKGENSAFCIILFPVYFITSCLEAISVGCWLKMQSRLPWLITN
nr:iron-sulfur cluster assembly enzyme ISCU, mitochondrial isoform X1 [Aotus nancymaae]